MTVNSTIAEAIELGLSELSVSSESPKQDVEVLLCDALQCSRTKLFTSSDSSVSETQYTRFLDYVAQRKTGRPVSYIIGHQDFWTLSLEVNESTLIPRPETELLVEQVLSLSLPAKSNVLDLGTGTGAIALAIASEKPQWRIVGSDRIAEAVELALQNRKRNSISNAEFIQSSWFDAFQQSNFNVIVSNPPYVESDSEYLQHGDLRFEPMSALASGGDGLDDIRTIISQAPQHLISGGWLLLEHGFEQGQAIRHLFQSNGFTQVITIKDYAGLERISLGQFCLD